VRRTEEAGLAFRQLDTATRRFLALSLITGTSPTIPTCASRRLQRAIVDYLPQSPASRCYRIVACGWPGSARRRAAFAWPVAASNKKR
jgi:hypothetical protein